MNEQLEKALHFAGEAGDIESLKSLARQEAKRAADVTNMLLAVLNGNLEWSQLHLSAEALDSAKAFDLCVSWADDGAIVVSAEPKGRSQTPAEAKVIVGGQVIGEARNVKFTPSPITVTQKNPAAAIKGLRELADKLESGELVHKSGGLVFGEFSVSGDLLLEPPRR